MRWLVAAGTALVLGGCPQYDIVGWGDGENPPPGPFACGDSGDRDNDGISDADEGDGDFDGDGIPNALDIDSDADRIQDVIEAGDGDCRTPPVDTDGDGAPDFLDRDSDDDGILDVHEGVNDPDRDGIYAFRDTDADGDGLRDALEAGDDDPLTRPQACPHFLDADSDDDGLTDAEELSPIPRTDPCRVDTDGDGHDDLYEATWTRHACASGITADCDCARRATCIPPPAMPYRVLDAGAEEDRQVDVELEAKVRRLDTLMLIDTSRGESDLVLAALREAMRPGTGLFDRVRARVKDTQFAVAEHSDFPLAPFGADGDVPFELVLPSTGVAASDPMETGRALLDAAFDSLTERPGGDGPGSHLEAIFQAMTGEGGTFLVQGGAATTIPAYADACPPGSHGAACFRDGALPLVVHVTGACAHGRRPGEDPACGEYTSVSPTPTGWYTVTTLLYELGARYVGVNTSATRCTLDDRPRGTAPCYLLSGTAEATGTSTTRGRPVLADVGGLVLSRVEDALFGVIASAVDDVPLDATLALTTHRTDPGGYGAPITAYAQTRCRALDVRRCWRSEYEPEDLAVGYADDATYYGAVPGTRLQAIVTLVAPAESRPRSRTFALELGLDPAQGNIARFDEDTLLVAVPSRGW